MADRVTVYKTQNRVQVYIDGAEFLDELFIFYTMHEILDIIKDRLDKYYGEPNQYRLVVKQWR